MVKLGVGVDLTTPTLWYLASPYSDYPDGLVKAFEDISNICAKLANAGIYKFYCPIVHSHPISLHLDNSKSYDFWLNFDANYMNLASGMIIAMIPGWNKSRGIFFEKGFFLGQKKPIYYYDPENEVISRYAVH